MASVAIEVGYEGALHTRAQHEPSGATLETDAPRDNEGLGESFSPTDLIATALGSCLLTVMGIVCRRHEWPLEGARADVQKFMRPAPDRRIARLEVRISMPAGMPPEARKPLERAARTCPVHRSLHPDIEQQIDFVWPDDG